MRLIIFFCLVFVVFSIWYLKNSVGSSPVHKNTLLCFTGAPGTNKTYLSVKYSLSALKQARRRWFFRKIFLFHKKEPKPQLFSNIPVRISKKEMSCKLLNEHFIPETSYSDASQYWQYSNTIPLGSIILIDEIGQFASQYDWNLDSVQNGVVPFVRFVRHWIQGKLICNDQTAESIAKGIRSRLGLMYYLYDLRKYFNKIYKVKAMPIVYSEDITTNHDPSKSVSERYFFGKFHKQGKHYDSYCYSDLYRRDNFDILRHDKTKLKASYFLDLRNYEKNMKKIKK